MSATRSPGFTPGDVAALAELVRRHLTGPPTMGAVVEAVARAAAHDEQEWYRRVGHVHLFTAALSGTYDEFRAEGVAP